jgi:hypothetical protein
MRGDRLTNSSSIRLYACEGPVARRELLLRTGQRGRNCRFRCTDSHE